MRICLQTILVFASATFTSPALALDLNSFRAEHRLPPLATSATLAGAAYAHAHDMARRNHLDHDGFAARARFSSGAAAENVLVMNCARPDAKPVSTFAGRACGGCDNQDCAIRMWAKSAGHRRNMLMQGVSAYGIASAVSDNGRKYWVMELGN